MTDTPAPNTPSNAASSAPNDVGAILKQARLRRGQSFEVVFQHTRIPKKFLEALEANRFDEFPAAVYLQGFLKSYCEHLDLDFEPLWSQVRPSQPKSDPDREHRAADPAPASPRTETRPTPPASRPIPAPASAPAYGPLAIVAGAVTLAVIVAIYWTMPRGSPKPPPPPPLVVQRPVEPPIPPVVLPPKKMTLQLTFRTEAWMSLRCDGKLRFEGRGPAGFTQSWTAMKEFAIRTSSPEDLNLNLDGKDVRLSPEMKDSSGEYLVKRPA